MTKSSAPDISGADETVRLGEDASAGPPPYLSVPQFKDCLGSKMDNGGASYWCKLDEKPEKCPLESWKQLHEAGEENAFKGSNCVD